MSIKQFVLILFFGLASSVTMAGEFDTSMKVKKLDGQSASLDEHVGKGKWTLVMFWETTCSVCKEQEPEYSKFHNEHKDKDAEVVAISIDGIDNVDLIKSYQEDKKLPYHVMVTDKQEVRDRYLAATDEQFLGTPTYLLFSPEGELKAAQPGMLPASSVEKYIASSEEK